MNKVVLKEVPTSIIRTELFFPEIAALGVEFRPAVFFINRKKRNCYELVFPANTVTRSTIGQSTSYIHVLNHYIPGREPIVERRYYSVFNGQYVGSVLQKILTPHP